MKLTPIPLCLILGLAVLATSCLPESPPSPAAEESQPAASPSPIQQDSSQPSPTEEPAATSNPLPPDSLEVVFFSDDGAELQGRFYPAATLGQPVVVLMHWYQGDQRDWDEIAYWLQNRGSTGLRRGVPWLDPDWFPTRPAETSFNVLTFTFRDCEGGCSQPLPEEWLRDASASLTAARSLQGVNPDQIAAIGASIGGDAAIGSCAAALAVDPLACLGALSLSPGDYLGESYPELVAQLDNASPPRPAWCLYDQSDPDAVVCQRAAGSYYYKESWQGGNLHGMHLLTSALDPLPLARLAEFLDLVFGSQAADQQP